jgi:hypothetical protein
VAHLFGTNDRCAKPPRHHSVDHEPEVDATAREIHEILDGELREELVGEDLRITYPDPEGDQARA